MLIDEIHTPDSSRYFHADGYAERQRNGEAQKQLSKEFVRQWLIAHDFMGREGQAVPVMDDEFVQSVTRRYVELFERLTGAPFIAPAPEDPNVRIQRAVDRWLRS